LAFTWSLWCKCQISDARVVRYRAETTLGTFDDGGLGVVDELDGVVEELDGLGVVEELDGSFEELDGLLQQLAAEGTTAAAEHDEVDGETIVAAVSAAGPAPIGGAARGDLNTAFTSAGVTHGGSRCWPKRAMSSAEHRPRRARAAARTLCSTTWPSPRGKARVAKTVVRANRNAFLRAGLSGMPACSGSGRTREKWRH
jgi:hypothetical protein